MNQAPDTEQVPKHRLLKAVGLFVASGLLGILVPKGIASVGRTWLASSEPVPTANFVLLGLMGLVVLGTSVFFLLRAAFRQLKSR